ncbi:isochorismatase family protein [Aquitalea sp. LB_tupeE]|uniref:isochorismatase family protein n=1 Tax=Aquitalea sp. LB_tupeE TaxID=2748078 RepID=UPI0015BA10AD|nr:isochorismatase family protein [Aquitalea sp. LB_tupeE]NWK80012.1 isochorismatase family protein [Aquitalea sp. LB_tupeE]
MRHHLLIIDPQNDFCDLPPSALPVRGANADLQRLAQLITRHGTALDGITVTLDSHHRYDIAHPAFWRGPAGEQPLLCPITLADVDAGRWLPAQPALLPAVRHYLQHCALFVWPPHCLVGSWGHNIHEGLNQALQQWECQGLQPVQFLFKGLNPLTEHFSAFEADLPLADDPATCFNPRQVATLVAAQRVIVAGEALSHCVASSVRSLLRHLGPDFARKLVLLEDCSSPVPGFEKQAEDFVAEIRQLGAHILPSTALFA